MMLHNAVPHIHHDHHGHDRIGITSVAPHSHEHHHHHDRHGHLHHHKDHSEKDADSTGFFDLLIGFHSHSGSDNDHSPDTFEQVKSRIFINKQELAKGSEFYYGLIELTAYQAIFMQPNDSLGDTLYFLPFLRRGPPLSDGLFSLRS